MKTLKDFKDTVINFLKQAWAKIKAFFESEEGQKEYEAWRQEQALLKAQKANNEA